MRDRVILMVGLYDTLDIFTYELKKEFEKIGVDAVEQCLPWWDMDGSKILRQKVEMQIMLDESIHSPVDAAKACKMDAADILNIKLMKCGGLYNALKIASAAEVYGVECMIGCMLEAKISVNAAVHLACAKQVITRVDLDGPVLCSEDPILGGAVFNEKEITVSNEPGLGIKGIEPGKIKYLD